jgi:alkane 1-monooxygenase
MILLSLMPFAWRRVMDPKVHHHFAGDISRANIQPGKREKIVSKYPTATSEYLTPEISKIEDSVLAEQAPAYQCPMCSYVYAPAQGDLREGFEPGTPFSQIPSTWVCPDCGVRERNEFLPLASV